MTLRGKKYSHGTVYLGDCLRVLREIPDNYYSAIITDPPYGISYGSNVGINWDDVLPSKYIWDHCLRVLKPGGVLMAFGGARTFHRITCQIEDAGFNIKDVLMWIYGEGFPKSANISKFIDKKLGAERLPIGYTKLTGSARREDGKMSGGHIAANVKGRIEDDNDDDQWLAVTAPATPQSQMWDGYGTTLKPAYEPICLAMKPMAGSYADNALEVGVSGINIDDTRTPEGRWPANLLFDEDEAAVLDKTVGPKKAGGTSFSYSKPDTGKPLGGFGKEARRTDNISEGTNNTRCSRYFYCSKPKRKERGENPHPTVKPLDLMKYLINFVKMPLGTKILDPFAGSGTTLHAAKLLGVSCDGIEREKEYFKYIIRRLEDV